MQLSGVWRHFRCGRNAGFREWRLQPLATLARQTVVVPRACGIDAVHRSAGELPSHLPLAWPANCGDALRACTGGSGSPDIAPEPFDVFSLRGAAYSMTTWAQSVRQDVQDAFPDDDRWAPALEALEHAKEVFGGLASLMDPGVRMRTHGHPHLGQVIHTGDDLVFIDFEGDVTRPLSERLIKTSPLADVASMLFSFRYASVSTSFPNVSGPSRGMVIPNACASTRRTGTTP